MGLGAFNLNKYRSFFPRCPTLTCPRGERPAEHSLIHLGRVGYNSIRSKLGMDGFGGSFRKRKAVMRQSPEGGRTGAERTTEPRKEAVSKYLLLRSRFPLRK